jgi:hypothetical protein
MTKATISRRNLFRGAALVSGVLVARPAAAQVKMAKTAVAYQATPKGSARCDGCALWLPPNACKMVEGLISPAGWCSIYVAKT